MPLALKAAWEVRAGIIPGQPMEEFSKAWHYTSQDYEADCAMPVDTAEQSRFQRMAAEARAYADGLVDPRRLNWVTCTWMWL